VKRLCGEDPRYRDRVSRRLPVPHGFRSTFFDWAIDTTHYPMAIVQAALAQKAGDNVTVAYRRGTAYDFRADLMADWGRFCDGSTGTGAPEREVALEASRLVNMLLGSADPRSLAVVNTLQDFLGRSRAGSAPGRA
jgi:hypothetical protein